MIVLDASALLALLHREAGWEVVARAVAADSATISAVNYAEVVQKAAQYAIAPEDVDAAVEGLGLTVTPPRSGVSTPASLPPSIGTAPGSAWATASAWRSPEASRALRSRRTGAGSAGLTTSASTSGSSTEDVRARPVSQTVAVQQVRKQSANSPQDVRKRPLLIVNDQRQRSAKQQLRRR